MATTNIRIKPFLWATLSLGLAFLTLQSGLQAINSMSVPDSWVRDFNILLSLSTVISLTLILWKNQVAHGFLVVARIITVLLICVPFDGLKPVETYLLTALVVDCSFSLKFVPATIMIIMAVVGTLFIQAGWSAYYFHVDVPSSTDQWAFGIWGLIFGAFCLYVNRLHELHQQKSEESDHRRQAVEELIGANRGYLEYASAVEEEISEKERKRIITELHDIVGQSFTNILAITELAIKHPPTLEEVEDVFSVVTSQARSGLDETRAILYKLHTFEAISPAGLKEFHRLVTVFAKSTGIQVDVNWSNLPWDLGREMNTLVHKLIRESLVNSYRHGQAKRIGIYFRIEKPLLFIEIVDDGKGGTNFEKGIGLSSLEEQIIQLSGHATFDSNTQGFSVHVELPLKP